MYKFHMIGVIFIIVINSYLVFTQQDNFSRESIYVPGLCPPNEVYYPGLDSCSCVEGALYYKPKAGCFPAYRQGPCELGEYLAFTDQTVKCKKNPCMKDTLVQLNGVCHKLGVPGGPCPPVNVGGGILGVNVNTHKIECLKPLAKGGNTLSIFHVGSKCPPGTKVSMTGKCRPVAG